MVGPVGRCGTKTLDESMFDGAAFRPPVGITVCVGLEPNTVEPLALLDEATGASAIAMTASDVAMKRSRLNMTVKPFKTHY